jgi:hypothetical protein
MTTCFNTVNGYKKKSTNTFWDFQKIGYHLVENRQVGFQEIYQFMWKPLIFIRRIGLKTFTLVITTKTNS